MIRPAVLTDLDALEYLERRCFDSDRLSRRSFRHLISHGHALTLVDERPSGRLAGYVLVLFRNGSSLARLYSIAVDPQCRGEDIGAHLAESAETGAAEAGCVAMRLEIRRDNQASLALFHGRGYRQIGTYPEYYDDAMDAVRLEKRLTGGASTGRSESTRTGPCSATQSATNRERK